ncbi:MAG: nucleotide sugar dehydrogenase, partial [Candidatus Omnitrophota bacterium]
MNITIVGCGYVGLVSGACFAELGNKVICVDNDKKKIEALRKGIIPIYEPGLEELVVNNMKKGRLVFSSSIKTAVKSSELIFIAVGTPSLENGEADLTGIENVSRDIAINMTGYRLIVEKSTVPVETGEWVKHTISTYVKSKVKFDVASNPEFLREGSAINDFLHPDRIVIGVESKRAKDILVNLYKPLKAPLVVTNIKSAELIKHASNAFLATKISFINAVSRIADMVGADISEVAEGMGLDKRINKAFLNAGL